MSLLQRQDFVACSTKLADGLDAVGSISPSDRILSTEGSLMNIWVWRACRDPTQSQPLETKGIGSAEDRPDIIHAPHIIEDDDDGELRFTTEGLCREALHLRDL